MRLTTKQIKQRYWDKLYSNAPTIECKCGCGQTLKAKDKYGRNAIYINGHNGRKYEDSTQYKREWNYRNREAKHQYKENYQRKRKVNLINLAGGKCQLCNEIYNGKNACIFQFHHRNAEEKSFGLNLNKMGKSWKSLLQEFKKCDLLCSNCHSKQHSSEF